MSLLKRNAGLLTITLLTFDAGCVFVACVVASRFTLPLDGSLALRENVQAHWGYWVWFMVIWAVVGTEQGLLASQRGHRLPEQLYRVGKTVVFALGISSFLIAFFRQGQIERDFILFFGIANLALLLLFRSAVRVALWVIRKRGFNYREILIVGANPRANHLINVMASHGRFGYHIAGILEDEEDRLDFVKDHNIPYLGRIAELDEVFREHVIDEVYVCLPVRKYYKRILSIAHLCESVGISVRMIADLFPLRIATSTVIQLDDIPLLSLSTVPEKQIPQLVKRGIDILVSLLFILLVTWWLFPMIAMIIKIDSKGPVFFGQERIGLNRRRFKMIKFRSMVPDADALKDALSDQNEADGPVFKIKHDPRITRVGKWIRKLSIDELPQFINVFLGDMSLVGPRPPLPKEVAEYTWDQRRRLSVRPGITGLQQVSGRTGIKFDDWVELDLTYIDNWSLMEDFRIILRTAQVVVEGRGAT